MKNILKYMIGAVVVATALTACGGGGGGGGSSSPTGLVGVASANSLYIGQGSWCGTVVVPTTTMSTAAYQQLAYMMGTNQFSQLLRLTISTPSGSNGMLPEPMNISLNNEGIAASQGINGQGDGFTNGANNGMLINYSPNTNGNNPNIPCNPTAPCEQNVTSAASAQQLLQIITQFTTTAQTPYPNQQIYGSQQLHSTMNVQINYMGAQIATGILNQCGFQQQFNGNGFQQQYNGNTFGSNPYIQAPMYLPAH